MGRKVSIDELRRTQEDFEQHIDSQETANIRNLIIRETVNENKELMDQNRELINETMSKQE